MGDVGECIWGEVNIPGLASIGGRLGRGGIRKGRGGEWGWRLLWAVGVSSEKMRGQGKSLPMCSFSFILAVGK